MGSGSSDAPEDSLQTTQLKAMQTGLLGNINTTVQQLDPTVFSQMGLKQAEQDITNPSWTNWKNQVEIGRAHV
jgi:hypothetical protein